MDEEEFMYRLMNEDDEFYMGDRDDEESEDNEKLKVSDNGNKGCIPLIVFAVLLLGMIF